MADSTMQSAALASIVGAIRRRQSLAQRSIRSQFVNVGRSFHLIDDVWSGPAVLSPDALFLFQFERGSQQTGGDPHAIKARDLLAIPRDPLSHTDFALTTVSSSELPPAITDHPDWPFPSIRECSVVIVPRESIAAVLYLPGTNGLRFMTGGRVVQVNCEMLSPIEAATYLRDNGWPTGNRRPPATRPVADHLRAIGFAGGSAGLLLLAALTINSRIGAQLGLILGIVLAAGAATLATRAYAQYRT